MKFIRLFLAKRSFKKRQEDLNEKGLYISFNGKLSVTKVDGKFKVYPRGGIHDLSPSEILQVTV